MKLGPSPGLLLSTSLFYGKLISPGTSSDSHLFICNKMRSSWQDLTTRLENPRLLLYRIYSVNEGLRDCTAGRELGWRDMDTLRGCGGGECGVFVMEGVYRGFS